MAEFDPRVIEQLVRESTEAQRLPERLEDPHIVHRVATLLDVDSAPHRRQRAS